MSINNNKKYMKPVIFIAVVYFLVFFTLKVFQYYALFSFEWQDEARNNQVVWNTAHGMFFYESIFDGRPWGFSGHFNPIFLVLSLGYLLFPHIFTWYFLTIAGVALGGVLVYKLSSMVFEDDLRPFLVSLFYFVYPPLHYLNFGRINTITFFVPLMLASFYFVKKNRYLYFVVSIILAMMCMESVSLYVILFAVYNAISGKTKKWVIVPFVLATVWIVASSWFILPRISSANISLDVSNHEFYSLDKETFGGLIKFIVFEPRECLAFMFSNGRYLTPFRLLLPTCFIALFSSVIIIGIPGFLQLFFMSGSLSNEGSYYIAGAIPLIILGYIYGLVRIDILLARLRFGKVVRERISCGLIAISIFVCIWIFFTGNIYGAVDKTGPINDTRFVNVKNIFDSVFYRMDKEDKIAWAMIRQIPKDASVSASGDLLIPLSHRTKLLEFGNEDEANYDYFDAEYIILNRNNMYHGAGHYSEIKQLDLDRLDDYIRSGHFEVLQEEGSFILLKCSRQLLQLG